MLQLTVQSDCETTVKNNIPEYVKYLYQRAEKVQCRAIDDTPKVHVQMPHEGWNVSI